MPAINSIQSLKSDLIRKATNGSVFLAPYSAPTVLTSSLFSGTTGDLSALPTGYGDLGFTTDAGAQWANQLTPSDITSWQSVAPTRTDITADVDTMQVALQETRAGTIGLYANVDQASLLPGSNGVMRIDKTAQPTPRYYRVLMLAVDEQADGEIVIGRYLPKALVTARDGQTFGKSGDPVLWSVTFTGYVDGVLGISGSWLFGGAGFKNRVTSMGMTLGASPG